MQCESIDDICGCAYSLPLITSQGCEKKILTKFKQANLPLNPGLSKAYSPFPFSGSVSKMSCSEKRKRKNNCYLTIGNYK